MRFALLICLLPRFVPCSRAATADPCSGVDEASCKALQDCAWTLRKAEVCDCPYANSDGSCPADCGVETREEGLCVPKERNEEELYYRVLLEDAQRNGLERGCASTLNVLRWKDSINVSPLALRAYQRFARERCGVNSGGGAAPGPGAASTCKNLNAGERLFYQAYVGELRRQGVADLSRTCPTIPLARLQLQSRGLGGLDRAFDCFKETYCP